MCDYAYLSTKEEINVDLEDYKLLLPQNNYTEV